MIRHRACLSCLALLPLIASTTARAAPIVAGDTTFHGMAVQDVTILGGTAFNQGPEFTLYGLSGVGYFTIHRQAQVGSTIEFTGGDSLFSGSYAGLGDYTFGTGAPLGGGSFHGMIENVMQNTNDPGFASGDPSSFASGDYTAYLDRFFFKLADGTILETGGVYALTATLDGLPPRTTTTLQGSATDRNPIYYGDPSNGLLIGYTTNGSIIVSAVPEPSALCLGGIAAAGVGLALIRRRGR
ncbi:PEP-CTERM sorting domain-containing protein [Aquisphaera insulae]|uniref:PEP-CTERM sorting domain-containing protein n=1 Tax=Aquisphaera insulae TaxID=2712864 RepID=UPI0013EDDC72|nr:PEP-CTERM sorting domain-containing protein [Aquisphaera insulae]